MELKAAIEQHIRLTYAQDRAGLAHLLCNLNDIVMSAVGEIETEFQQFKELQISLRSNPAKQDSNP